MKKKIFITLAALLTLFGCDFFTEVNNEAYPAKITYLTPADLNKLQEEFDQLNNQNCIKLDQYGFVDYSLYCNRELTDSITKEYLIKESEDWLVKNKKFTGVDGKNNLEIDEVIIDPVYRVRFKEQMYKGYKIIRSGITLWLDNKKVYQVDGHWYKYVYIPPKDNFSVGSAKEKLIGTEITWYNFGGQPQKFVVTADSYYPGGVQKVIFPKIINNSIELRVVWQISVGKDFPAWYIYFDSTTGEIVEIEQLFMT